MIDIKFISALTHTIKQCSNHEEALWLSQSLTLQKMQNKIWLYNECSKFVNPNKILILGCWYPTLLPYLFYKKGSTIVCVDKDSSLKRVSDIFNNYLYDHNPVQHIVADAKDFMYAMNNSSFDLIINTSCEHMNFDMKDLDLPQLPLYAFQSNNYEIKEHINTKQSLNEFVDSTGLNNVYYSGTQKMKKYERYMVIGKYNG